MTTPRIHHQSEAYPDGSQYRGQVVAINTKTHRFRVLWVTPTSYNSERAAHLMCERWAGQNGIDDLQEATDSE